jgi:hypothetical protein
LKKGCAAEVLMHLNYGEANPPQGRCYCLRVIPGIGEDCGVRISRIANDKRDTAPVVGPGLGLGRTGQSQSD